MERILISDILIPWSFHLANCFYPIPALHSTRARPPPRPRSRRPRQTRAPRPRPRTSRPPRGAGAASRAAPSSTSRGARRSPHSAPDISTQASIVTVQPLGTGFHKRKECSTSPSRDATSQVQCHDVSRPRHSRSDRRYRHASAPRVCGHASSRISWRA